MSTKIYHHAATKTVKLVHAAYTPVIGDVQLGGIHDHPDVPEEGVSDGIGPSISHAEYEHVWELLARKGVADIENHTLVRIEAAPEEPEDPVEEE